MIEKFRSPPLRLFDLKSRNLESVLVGRKWRKGGVEYNDLVIAVVVSVAGSQYAFIICESSYIDNNFTVAKGLLPWGFMILVRRL